MRKVFLLCMVFAFSNTFFAQTKEQKAKEILGVDTKQEKAAKEAKAKKILGVDSEREKAAKEAKAKKILNVDKSKKVTTVPLKKDGTPDKRFKVKSNNASATGRAKSAEGKAKAAANKSEAKVKKATKERVSNERAPKTPDKVTGFYKGKKVYTGPRGGKYYINSNGNKTYISEDK